jgi:hypothetical protein
MRHSTPRAGAEPQVKRARQRAEAHRGRPDARVEDLHRYSKSPPLLSF